MLSYLPIAVTLIAGILAFFFAKDGERNKVGGVGWAMAGLLVFGSLVTAYINYDTRQRAAESERQAKQEADERAVAEGVSRSLAVMQSANLDTRQQVGRALLSFEFANTPAGGVEPSPPGFIGPLPLLPDKVIGLIAVALGDTFAQYRFRTGNAQTIAVDDPERGQAFVLRQGSIEVVKSTPDRSNPNVWGWFAQQEPAPSGFVYGTSFPVDTQLRRIIAALASDTSLGHVRFPKAQLSDAQLNAIAQGFAKLAPAIIIHIGEGSGEDVCNHYLTVPLRIVPEPNFVWDDQTYDALSFRLTRNAFRLDPCNNNPF